MDSFLHGILLLLLLCVHQKFTSGFNPITFVKNWSLRGSASFLMPKDFPDTRQLIERAGYGWEGYQVTTQDGYVLRLTRIVPRTGFVGGRPPLMIVHGVLATSECWVSRGRSQDLAFLLTEMGFDVWLPDLRGNAYGKHHKYLSPRNPRFWEFSFHEIGSYDLPAFIDFILAKTGAPQMGYIGHSMGTTVFLVMTSTRPDYNSKIWGAVLLAPVASKFPFEEIHNPALRIALTQFGNVYEAIRSAGIHEILPRTPRLVYNVRKYCTGPPEQDYCLDFIGQFYGEHRSNLDRKHFGSQIMYLPAGASLKTMNHFAQLFNFGFHLYDYGAKENLLRYNSTMPPAYPLHHVTVPTLLLHGENDPLTSIQGTNFLTNMIPGVKQAKLVPDHKYTHADFVLGLNTNETIHGDIINFLIVHAPH